MCAITEEYLQSTLCKAEKLDLPCAIHAIGDAANRMVLDAISASCRESSAKQSRRLRHRIEHCQLLHPADVPRFGALNVVASVQPTHIISDIDLIGTHWDDRARYAYPFASLARMHTQLIFGSDAPVEQPNPMATIHAAITRTRSTDNKSLFKDEEALSFGQALAASTHNPADVAGQSSDRGNIAVEKYADFIRLNGALSPANPEELRTVQIAEVYYNGEKVFNSNQTRALATEESNW
jgi:predicted amidohydrolase YtcJ